MTEDTDWNAESIEYTGDVTLTRHDEVPVVIDDPADAFVKTGSVRGDLEVLNPEYVFTHQPVGSDASIGDPETVIEGDLEDGYVDRDGVHGGAIVADAEDVFVERDAVSGTFEVTGAENVYTADGEPPSLDPSAYDVSLTGWEQSTNVDEAETGVYVTGGRHEVTVGRAAGDLDVYVSGYGHAVRIDGGDADVSVSFIGYDNAVSVGPHVSAETVSEAGYDNRIESDPFPVSDLIETSRREAYRSTFFGRRKVTYQEPATDEDWCPNCGTDADAIIERREEEALFLLGFPLFTFDSGGVSYECEECSLYAAPDGLTEKERKRILD